MEEQKLIKIISPFMEQAPDVKVGPGDDCAAVDVGGGALMLLAADQVVSGVHFSLADTPPGRAAAKLLNRNLSDIAAMGGTPAHAIVTIATSIDDEQWLVEFFKGLGEEASRRSVSVCGGDISRLPPESEKGIVASLTITGFVTRDRICLRSGASEFDLLYATGEFGNSLASGRHLSFTPRLEEGKFLSRGFASSMIDVSDGLLTDAAKLAEASGLSLEIDTSKIPLRDGADIRAALGDGEDYELVFSVPQDKAEELEKSWPFKNTRLTRVGQFMPGAPGRVADENGADLMGKHTPGYDHFKK